MPSYDGFVPLANPNVRSSRLRDAFEDDEDASARDERQKRGRRRRVNAQRAFAERVLKWNVKGLRTNARAEVGERALAVKRATYANAEAWYEEAMEVAYEEARATLANALMKGKDRRDLFEVEVRWTIGAPNEDERGVVAVEARATNGGASGDWRKPATALVLRRRIGDEGVLAIVAAMQDARGGEIVPLWMRACDCASAESWVASTLDSLITHQRMAYACFLRPKVAFAHQLIGHKPSTHTKFVDSDSEGYDARREVLMGADETSTLETNGALNASQRRAMHRFLTQNGHMDQLQMVQGPPGCGKTHFTVALLRELTDRNQRVLVCAPSNKAVVVAMELYLRTASDSRDSSCVLIGVEESLEECSTSLNDDTKSGAMDYFIYRRARAIASGVERSLAEMKAEKLSRFSFNAVVEALNIARRQLKTIAPQFLKRELNGDFYAVEELLNEMDATKADEIQRRGAELVAKMSKASNRGELSDEFTIEALNQVQVVFCTLASSGQSLMAMLTPPDVLLVDEAAQALEPEIAIPLLRNPGKCLLVGDPAQLPATMSSEIARRLGHATSLMERLMSINDERVSLLDTQYRMHESIAKWPSAHFYANRLLTAESVAVREPPPGFPGFLKPYTFVDVHEGEESGKHGESKINQREARVACSLIETLVRYQQAHTTSFTVVVIAFYSAQVSFIARMLALSGIRHVAVHSVDSFQGSEADIVICSAVRNNKANTVGFLADKRRLNVALTRARHALVVLASAKTLSGGNTDLKALVDDARSRDVIVTEREFLDSFS